MKKQYSKQYENTVKNYKKSNKKLKPSEWIVIALMAFWTLASVFGTIAFVRQNSSSVDMLSASAATTTVENTNSSKTLVIDPQGLDGYSFNGEYASVIYEDNTLFQVFTDGVVTEFSVIYYSFEEFWYTRQVVTVNDLSTDYTFTMTPKAYNGFAGGYYVTTFSCRVTTYGQVDVLPVDIIPVDITYSFYANEKLTLDFEFFSSSQNETYNLLFEFTQLTDYASGFSPYLYTLGVNVEPVYIAKTVEEFDQAVNNAYLQGVDEQSQYWQSQVENAFNNGKSQGIDIGYTQGLNDANTYSFSGLLSAIIDVPINAFRSMFDFNFLGINMAQFGFSVLSLCAVVVVVKLFL